MQASRAVMRPGILRRALVVAGCGALTVTLSACESTEQESAKIAREGKALSAGPAALKVGAANREVRVSDTTLLHDSGRAAVAVRLTSTSPRAQRNLPVLVSVTGAGGKVAYSNAAGGAEASLQRLALLPRHASEWWVDDQVLGAQSANHVVVRVGSGTRTRSSGALPVLQTRRPRVGQQSGISVLNGELVNRSQRPQGKVPVFAVAVRAGKVVAAGRAVVDSLPGHAGASAAFQIFLVGNPAGARIELTAVPTAA